MMKLAEIGLAAETLESQLGAGVDLVQVLRGLQRLQPQHADLWEQAERGVLTGGHPLSRYLAGAWPETMVAAVRAGEESGTVDRVMAQIEQTVEMQLSIRGHAAKLIYPALGMLGGLVGFLVFMVFVLPMARGLGNSVGKSNWVFQLSAVIESVVLNHGLILLGAIIGGLTVLVSWARSEAGHAAILELALDIPMVSRAITNLAFGLWAKYMALAAGAGIPTLQAITSTAAVLPGSLRASVELFADDLGARQVGMADGSDLGKLEKADPDDLRVRWWPVLISNAFMQADKAGNLDVHMAKASPKLMEAGRKAFDQLISVLNLIALFAAALLILTPLAAFYVGIFSGMGKS